MPIVAFVPSGKKTEVPAGIRLIEACRLAGFPLPAPCGEKGLCGKCRVRVLEGEASVDRRQIACLPSKLLALGWRAACVAEVEGDLILADPDESRDGVILTDFMTREARGESGLWERDIVLPEPSMADQRDDQTRLFDALGAVGPRRKDDPFLLDIPLLARLPDILRRTGFHCRALGLGRRIVALRDSSGEWRRGLGLAVDIGTTTLAAALCDLADGRILSVASQANPQAVRGDDVISRVDYASRGPDELAEMRSLIVKALEELSGAARREAGCAEEPVLVAVGGNTAMNHLLVGASPQALALAPFIPAFMGPLALCASQLGWRGAPPPFLMVVPNVSAYVGGDITAGLLAHEVHRLGGNTLFLDVGTNGEMALASGGAVYACATAAGPAFEGARIKQGMRAIPGAIARIGLSEKGLLEIGVVDSLSPAQGLCGTGLLDAVAVLLGIGIIDAGGRLLDADEARAANPRLPQPLLDLLHNDGGGPAIWLERPADGGHPGVALTQRDVREFQLAKGAVAAGVKVLLEVAGIGPENLDRVLLAGGFGNYLDPASALAAGLLPAGIDRERVRSVGNASLAGTRLYMLSEGERAEAAELSRFIKHLELSGRADFQEAFAEAMLFPERMRHE